MFTPDNSLFRGNDLHIVNEAVARLLGERIDEDTSEEDEAQITKSVDDAVNNAWVEGCTSNEIVEMVRGGHTSATRQRGPSNFDVIARPSNESHGIYNTLDEARGCVEFDRLRDYEIWQGDRIVEEEG